MSSNVAASFPSESPPAKANILLVDDHPPNLLALRALLDDLGHNLVEARSGAETLELLAEQDFAVVLLDVQMEGLDGFETARLIRRREAARHVPIIFLTAFENSRLPLEEAYALGAVDYLIKPLVPVILRAKVAGFIELFQKSEQIKRQAEQLRQVQRLEFEQKLAEENARFRALTEHSSDAVTLVGPDGTVLYTSPSCKRILGYEPDEFLGRSGFEVVHPDDRETVSRRLWELVQSPEQAVMVELRARHKDGSWRWMECIGTNLLAEPAVRAIVVNFRDISVRRQIIDSLRETDRRKDEFLAMLAHELRNPLAPIRNAVEILKLLGPPDPILQQARETIDRQVRHLTRLVDDLLDVSRITSGKIKLQREAVEMTVILARAVETSRPLLDERRHTLTLTLSPETIHVAADATRLAQVVSNLLNNAAKYTEEGGNIELSMERRGDEAVLRVRDNGIGIAPDLLPHVFDLFAQGDRSLARSEGGLGIGLTLVKKLVELHEGSIEAHSEGTGKGSEFVVRLPILECETAADDTAAQASMNGPMLSRRVLVVDDNKDAAESLALLLRADGHVVDIAHDGESALRMIEAFAPHIVLLDIGLPGMDGYEVGRRIREQPGGQEVLLVAVTGYGQEEDRRRTEEAGFHAHFTKPADPIVLRKLLSSWSEPRLLGERGASVHCFP